MIKVLIADDIQILRQGLKAILSQDRDIEVVSLAGDGEEAYRQCQKLKPDIVLMDMCMPHYDGAYGIEKIKESLPKTKVLVLTTFDDEETVNRALASGADGYLLKEMADDKMIQAVKTAYTGVRVFGDSVFEGLKARLMNRASLPSSIELIEKLTPRERDILQCLARGMDNKEISSSLFLAEGTVRNNISKLLEKLQLKDRTQLAVFAVKNNLD